MAADVVSYLWTLARPPEVLPRFSMVSMGGRVLHEQERIIIFARSKLRLASVDAVGRQDASPD